MAEQEQDRVDEVATPEGATPAAAFARLGFNPAELAAIKRQGSIHQEVRGKHTIVFKLFFRLEGRQRVKYLGTDREQVSLLQQYLEQLQDNRLQTAQVRTACRAAAQLLRETKQRLAPWVARAGLRFHGRTIRQPRRMRPKHEVDPLVNDEL
jgi:hypothetical protein